MRIVLIYNLIITIISIILSNKCIRINLNSIKYYRKIRSFKRHIEMVNQYKSKINKLKLLKIVLKNNNKRFLISYLIKLINMKI